MAVKSSASVTVADISDGIDGTGIESVTVEYQAGSSGTVAPTGSWSTDVPSTSASTPYLWTRVIYIYTDGSDPKIVYSVGSTPEGIEIGGRNVVLKGNVEKNAIAGSVRYDISDYGKQSILDKQVCISFDAKGSEDLVCDAYIRKTSGFEYTSSVFNVTTEWNRFYAVVRSASEDVQTVAIRNDIYVPGGSENEGKTIYVRNVKVELGNKATDWTPAPEDIDANIESVSNALDVSMDVIVGTQTGTTGAWTGVAKFSELKDGQRIAYWLPYNGSGNATLNLTLANGTTTGAINCYYGGLTRLTTQYPAGNVIHFTYKENMAIANSINVYTGWWADANYYQDTYDRVRYSMSIKAGSGITAGNIIVGKDGLYSHLKTGNAFDVNMPILYAVSTFSANATSTTNYLAIPFAVNTTQSMTLEAYKPVYIKGTLSGTLFTPVSTTPLTQTVPTSEDDYQYILLGTAYSETSMYLLTEHPIFQYANGEFRSMDNIASEANKKIDKIVLEVGASSITLTDEAIAAITKQFIVQDENGSQTIISGGKINIGGFEIGDGYIRDLDSNNRYCGMGRNGITQAFYAGATVTDGSDGVFRVGHDGLLTATNAKITGSIEATNIRIKELVKGDSSGRYLILDTADEVTYSFGVAHYSTFDGLTIRGMDCGIEMLYDETMGGRTWIWGTIIDIMGNITSSGSLSMTDTIYVNTSNANGIQVISNDTALTATSKTYGTKISFGVGGSGYNRGIWDFRMNRWMFYGDSSDNVYINSLNTQVGIMGNGDFRLKRYNDTAGAFFNIGKYQGLVYEDASATYASINFRYQTGAGSAWSYTSVAGIMSTLSSCLKTSGGTLNNANYIYARNTRGTGYGMVGCSSSNGFHFGHGGYDSSYGSTYFSGNTVYMRGKTHLYRNLSWESNSDARLKHDIKNLPDEFIDVYMDINPVQFIWNDNPTVGKQMGVIAQQVLEAFEKHGISNDNYNIVTLANDTETYGFRNYTVNYDFLNVATMSIVQKHEKRIKELEDELAELKSKIS